MRGTQQRGLVQLSLLSWDDHGVFISTTAPIRGRRPWGHKSYILVLVSIRWRRTRGTQIIDVAALLSLLGEEELDGGSGGFARPRCLVQLYLLGGEELRHTSKT